MCLESLASFGFSNLVGRYMPDFFYFWFGFSPWPKGTPLAPFYPRVDPNLHAIRFSSLSAWFFGFPWSALQWASVTVLRECPCARSISLFCKSPSSPLFSTYAFSLLRFFPLLLASPLLLQSFSTFPRLL